MTFPSVSLGAVPPAVLNHVKRMAEEGFQRDQAMSRVRMVRDGRSDEMWPDEFSERYDKPMVANFIDQSARDLASNLSPLPSLACSAGNMRSDADKKRASTKNKIGAYYWRTSKLEVRMKWAADQYITYGFLPGRVEADYKNKRPRIVLDDPEGCYFDLDRNLDVRRYYRVWDDNIFDLAAQFPEFENRILLDESGHEYQSQKTPVVRWIDEREEIMFLPQRENLVLARFEHGMSHCPVRVALRPGLHLDPRGLFDDAIYVQLARAIIAALTLEAGHKAVQAPIVVPPDTQELAIGPDATIVTEHGDKVGRVRLEVPQAAFALGSELGDELHETVGYPESRLGNPSASAITGRGISALEGGFDSQIKLGQDVMKQLLRDLTGDAFEMDEMLWPNVSKTISGVISGESFELTYRPKQAINGQHDCDVSYGFASGLNPNAAIVTMLQLRGDKLIGRDTVRRQLPFDIDVEHEQREVDVQDIQDAMMQGLSAALQAAGPMVAQGQAQQAMQFYTAAAKVIAGREKGQSLTDLIVEAFTPPEPPPGAVGPGAPGDPAAGGAGGDLPPGMQDSGLMQGVAPGQAGMAPGGRPSVADLTAGFTGGGRPVMNDLIRRRIPTG